MAAETPALSVLIVEKNLEELEQLRQILSAVGFRDIRVASSVNMALSLVEEGGVDICFLIYDLGAQEKNGLQLLQELKAAGYHTYLTLFLLVADPEHSRLLLGSPELSPDGYLNKPYDKARIRTQLEKLLRIRKVLMPLYQLRHQQRHADALQLCERLLEAYPGIRPLILRIHGLILLEQGDHARALQLFEQISKVYDKPWVRVAIGMASFHLADYGRARQELSGVIDEQQLCVEAFCWLARIHWMSGERSEAVTLLRKAVMLQPTVPLLQGELASRAAFAEDYRIAADAFRKAVTYARYSAFQNPEYYFGLVRVLQQQLKQGGGGSALIEEAIRTLEAVVHDFVEQPLIRFRARLMAAEIYVASRDMSNADFAADDALNWFERLPVAEQVALLELLVEGVESTTAATRVKALKKTVADQMGQFGWGRSNLLGMIAFRRKDIDEAFGQFSAAWRADVGNVGVGLNLLQSGIEVLRGGAQAEGVLQVCAEVVTELQFGALSMRQQARFQILNERLSEWVSL